MQIIPNFSALAYPLEDGDSNFKIRQCILAAMRDKVLLPILKNYEPSEEECIKIRPIMAVICFATADRSRKHQEFMTLSDRMLFNDRRPPTPTINLHVNSTEEKRNVSPSTVFIDSLLGKDPNCAYSAQSQPCAFCRYQTNE